MSWFDSLNLRGKLLGGFALVALVAVVVGVVGSRNISRIARADTEMYETILVPIVALSEANQQRENIRVDARSLLLTPDAAESTRLLAALERRDVAVDSLLKVYERFLLNQEDSTNFRRLHEAMTPRCILEHFP